jgi:hypothetical protein
LGMAPRLRGVDNDGVTGPSPTVVIPAEAVIHKPLTRTSPPPFQGEEEHDEHFAHDWD